MTFSIKAQTSDSLLVARPQIEKCVKCFEASKVKDSLNAWQELEINYQVKKNQVNQAKINGQQTEINSLNLKLAKKTGNFWKGAGIGVVVGFVLSLFN